MKRSLDNANEHEPNGFPERASLWRLARKLCKEIKVTYDEDAPGYSLEIYKALRDLSKTVNNTPYTTSSVSQIKALKQHLKDNPKDFQDRVKKKIGENT
jgi:hypothetical protein